MSYRLGHTEEDTEVKRAVDEVQEYYNAQEKREWVEWAGKTLMPHLHAQIAMEKADTEQDVMDKVRQQVERVQREEERVAKEAELDETEAKYIRQVNTKEIDEDRFRELVGELDLERAMGESIAEGLAMTQAMTQDKEIGESERDESAEEELAVVAKAVESLTVGKGKGKAAPARAKVYGAVEGPVSILPSRRQYALTSLLTVRPMPDAQGTAKVHHDAIRATLQEVSDRQEQVLLEGAELRSH
jgi:hypothetical protein